MKKIYLIFACILFNLSIKAQDDTKCGIYIDSTFADKIDCWSFNYMYGIFPIDKATWKKFNRINIVMVWKAYGSQTTPNWFSFIIEPNEIDVYFPNDAKYGVYKFLRDKATDKVSYDNDMKGLSFGHSRTVFGVHTDKGSAWWLEVKGQTLTGEYYYDTKGNKKPKYNSVALYKSKVVAVSEKLPSYKEENLCPVVGIKISLKIEPAGGYKENLGIIK